MPCSAKNEALRPGDYFAQAHLKQFLLVFAQPNLPHNLNKVKFKQHGASKGTVVTWAQKDPRSSLPSGSPKPAAIVGLHWQNRQ